MFGRKHHGDQADTEPAAPVARWVVPLACPNCGARVDQAVEASETDPRCTFCHEALPVQPVAVAAPDIGGDIGALIAQALGGVDPNDLASKIITSSTTVISGPTVIDTKAHLHTDGVAGQATIVSARDLGIPLGNSHVLEIQLQVELPGRAPYLAMSKTVVPASAAGQATQGGRCAVKVDPNDEHTVLIEWA